MTFTILSTSSVWILWAIGITLFMASLDKVIFAQFLNMPRLQQRCRGLFGLNEFSQVDSTPTVPVFTFFGESSRPQAAWGSGDLSPASCVLTSKCYACPKFSSFARGSFRHFLRSSRLAIIAEPLLWDSAKAVKPRISRPKTPLLSFWGIFLSFFRD